jgi:hypothetical protein
MIFPINKSTISHSLKSTLLYVTFVFFFDCSDCSAQICNDPLACNFSIEATDEDVNCDFCSCSGGTWFETSEVEYGVEIEAIAEHSEGDLSGMTTYRLYLTVPSENDVIINFTGNDEFTLSLATTTSFYQEPVFGGVTPENISAAAIGFIPNLAYDSWVTVGLDGPASSLESATSLLPGAWSSQFENGNSFTVDDGTGSGWYVLPGATNSVAGSDLRILFAQLTTDGIVSGSFRSQVFQEGDQINDVRPDIEFLEGNSDNICGCMDDAACNYNPLADYDEDACEYSDTFYDCNGICLTDLDECGVCGGSGIAEGDCNCDGEQLDVIGVCGGSCTEDIDSDGVCDDIDDCIGDYDSCGVCNGPGDIYECGCTELPSSDCDCGGIQLDALNICGGDCDDDLDDDGVCDDIDDCVGEYDSCGICNGQGVIYECGCSDIPEGDCNCEGEQLDVIGVCGGSCTEDIDSDGVCDDIDECVGEFDSCGVCNGPGAIYECGCAELPEVDCNCDGEQLDVLGECGGDCTEDDNENGICDIDEYGCTDSSNPNFNPNAAFDDGSCFIGGCLSENACNYNPEAEYQIFGACDFTSCLGCIDTEACNYNPTASIDNGSCNYANLNYNCDGLCINDTDSDNICDENEIEGCTDVSNPGYDPYATDDDGSCLIGGCTLPIACNYDSSAGYLDITLCDFNFCLGCMDPNACNYNPEATLSSPATCTFPPVPFRDCSGICDNDNDGDGICDEQEIGGCTDIQAVNFNPNATDDNGSCVIQVGGCILPFACNYDPLADYYLPGSCDFSCLGG